MQSRKRNLSRSALLPIASLALAATLLGAAAANAAIFVPAATDLTLNGSVKIGNGASAGGSNFGPSLHYSIDGGRSEVNTTAIFSQGSNPAGKYEAIAFASDLSANGIATTGGDYVQGRNQIFLDIKVDVAGTYRISWELGGEQGDPARHIAPVTNRFTFTSSSGATIAGPVGTPGPASGGFNVVSGTAYFYAIPSEYYELQLNQSLFEQGNPGTGGGYGNVYSLITIDVPEPASLALLGAVASTLRRRRVSRPSVKG